MVSSARPEAVAAYLKMNDWPFLVVADPTRESYRRFGLERTSWRAFLNPRILARYLRLMLRGWLPHRAYDAEDLLQLGGDFVLDRRRRLVFAHPSSDPTDRPSAETLVEAVRTVVGETSHR